MNDLLHPFTEPWTFEFMRRAFLVSIMAGAVCGVVGSLVVLRGMTFISDAVAHSVFPGVAIGFVLRVDLVLSGAAAGIVTALAIAGLSQNRRLKEDAVIGVLFALAFGLGIVIVSTQDSYTGDLASFLFGQILGVSDRDVLVVAVIGVVLLITTLSLQKELTTVALDRETAQASGLPVFWLDALLYVMVTLSVVISLHAVGNILVLALLVTPAASARFLTDRLGRMMLWAAIIGALSCLAGLYVSYYVDLASGGLIVILLSSVFLICWLLAPRHGLVAKRLVRTRSASDKTLDLPGNQSGNLARF